MKDNRRYICHNCGDTLTGLRSYLKHLRDCKDTEIKTYDLFWNSSGALIADGQRAIAYRDKDNTWRFEEWA